MCDEFVWTYIGHTSHISLVVHHVHWYYLHISISCISQICIEHQLMDVQVYEDEWKWLGNIGKQATGVTIKSHLP